MQRQERIVPFLLIAAAALWTTSTDAEKTKISQEVVFLGVDFTHAVFYDEHFVPDHLLAEEIPSWNEGAAFYFGRKMCAEGTAIDLKISESQNANVPRSAVTHIAPSKKDAPPLTADLVRSEIAPYVSPSTSGVGILVVMDQVNKRYGAIGQVIVFGRSTGEPKAFDRFKEGGHGHGVRNYYMNPIKEIAGKACKFLHH